VIERNSFELKTDFMSDFEESIQLENKVRKIFILIKISKLYNLFYLYQSC